MLKVFISHSTKDLQIVMALADYLKRKGIYGYIAERDYQVGKPLTVKVMKNIETSDYFLVLYTTNGRDSSFVNQEIGYWIKARDYNNFIPLVEKGVKPEGLLSGLEYIRFVPENQNIGISNTIKYLEEKKKEKEIELESYGLGVLFGLGILGLTALILYALYKSEID